MPLVACGRQPAPDLVGKALPQLQRPLQHGLVADDDAAHGQQFVHYPQARREAEVEPDGVAEDLSREAAAGVAGNSGQAIKITPNSGRLHSQAAYSGCLGWRTANR